MVRYGLLLGSVLAATCLFGDAVFASSGKSAKPGNTVKRCTQRAEQVSKEEIPKWFMKFCTYKATDDDDDGLQAQRLRRRWRIAESLNGKALETKCTQALKDLMDDKKNRRMREAKMKEADRKKDRLIAEYSQKKKLTKRDKDYLLAEGVIVEDDGTFSKTKDKLLDLRWHDVNPVNVDANEWGMKYIYDCRQNPDEYLAK